MKTYTVKPYTVFAQRWETGEDLQVIVNWLNEREIPWHSHIEDGDVGTTTVDDDQDERWPELRDRVTSLCYDWSDEELDKGRWFVAREVEEAGGRVVQAYDNLTDEAFHGEYAEVVIPRQREEPPCA